MALLETPTAQTNFKAPDFKLKNIDGSMLSYNDIKGAKGTIVMFICNHCPYVKAIIDRLVKDCIELEEFHGIKTVAIMPNDTENYPADSYENMQKFASSHSMTFPYLIDETQETAKAYGAVCTPDIYGFNADGVLQYRGRCDSAGPNEAEDGTVRELMKAMIQIAETGRGPSEQFPSMGCSIKWK